LRLALLENRRVAADGTQSKKQAVQQAKPVLVERGKAAEKTTSGHACMPAWLQACMHALPAAQRHLSSREYTQPAASDLPGRPA